MFKIFIVDNNPSDRDALIRILEKFTCIYWLKVFSNPHEALHDLLQGKPDIVITAVEFPEMNGLTFSRKLLELLPAVHVIVTARSDQYAREAYEVGARSYLIKPFAVEPLEKAISNITKFKKDIG